MSLSIGESRSVIKSGKFTMYGPLLKVVPDPKTLQKLLPLTDELQNLSRNGPDNLIEMGNIVTAALSKYKPLIEITDAEVDEYLDALVFEEMV